MSTILQCPIFPLSFPWICFLGNPMGRSVRGREGFSYFWVPWLNYLQTICHRQFRQL